MLSASKEESPQLPSLPEFPVYTASSPGGSGNSPRPEAPAQAAQGQSQERALNCGDLGTCLRRAGRGWLLGVGVGGRGRVPRSRFVERVYSTLQLTVSSLQERSQGRNSRTKAEATEGVACTCMFAYVHMLSTGDFSIQKSVSDSWNRCYGQL